MFIKFIQVALSLLFMGGFVTGCGNSSSTLTSSTYPADISGYVTSVETVQVKYDRNKPDTMELTPLEGKIFWIVDISVINKTYKGEITASYKDWKVVAGDNVYDSQKPFMDIWPSVAMTVPVGGTGKTIIRFSVPDTLKVSDAKLCYQGQEPYSYSKLTGGDKVAVYNWDLKKVVLEEIKPTSTRPMIMRQIACLAESSDQITVVLEPTNEAVPDLTYKVAVKKGDVIRTTTFVSWIQAELQARQAKGFQFPTTPDEFQFYAMDRNQLGYIWKNLSKEFTVITYTGKSSQIIEYLPVAPSSFNWWFIWIPLIGVVLLIVCLRILKKVIATRKEGIAERCPECSKPWAQVYDGSEVIGEEHDERLDEKHVTDTHYDKHWHVTGRTRRTVLIPTTHYDITSRYFYHCKFCGHEWTSNVTRRVRRVII